MLATRPTSRNICYGKVRWKLVSWNTDDGAGTDLGHDSVGSGSLLVLEDDVTVAVGDELVEAVSVAGDRSLGQAARTERVLGNVGSVLLEDEWRHLASSSSNTGAATWSARRHLSAQQHRDQQTRRQRTTLLHLDITGHNWSRVCGRRCCPLHRLSV